jgi:hypothetical protein
MKNFKQVAVNVAVICVMCLVGRAVSQDKNAGAGAGQEMPDMATMMKKWMATINPGPNHKWLDQFAGKWKTTTKMWMGGPGTPALETSGTAEIKWVLDGRYLHQEFKGEMMFPDETGQMKKMPHHGMGFTGYDNYRKMYVGNWQDNLSTAMLTFTGTKSPDGKTMTMYGQMDEPMLDTVGRMVKYVTRVESDKKFIFEIYDLHAGDNYKVIEVVYERQ